MSFYLSYYIITNIYDVFVEKTYLEILDLFIKIFFFYMKCF